MYAIRSYYVLGFAAGVMIAASFWSLLAPGIEMAELLGDIPWLTAAIGFMAGGIFMRLVDKILPHLVITSYSIHYTKLYDRMSGAM